MKLTAELVVTLAQKRALIAKLNAEEEQLSNDLKDLMIELGLDEFAPSTLPMKLVKLEYEQTKDGFYKKMAIKFAKHIFGARWRAELEREHDKFPKRDVVALRVIAGNENYQQSTKVLEKAG